MQSNLPNEKSQRTETVYDGKTLCNCQWEEPSANPSSGNAAMLLNFWTHKCPWPMVHVWLLYQASCQDAVFSATHGRSFVGVPKAALGSVLGCPPPRKDKGKSILGVNHVVSSHQKPSKVSLLLRQWNNRNVSKKKGPPRPQQATLSST